MKWHWSAASVPIDRRAVRYKKIWFRKYVGFVILCATTLEMEAVSRFQESETREMGCHRKCLKIYQPAKHWTINDTNDKRREKSEEEAVAEREREREITSKAQRYKAIKQNKTISVHTSSCGRRFPSKILSHLFDL